MNVMKMMAARNATETQVVCATLFMRSLHPDDVIHALHAKPGATTNLTDLTPWVADIT
jgi:hypothetical protein